MARDGRRRPGRAAWLASAALVGVLLACAAPAAPASQPAAPPVASGAPAAAGATASSASTSASTSAGTSASAPTAAPVLDKVRLVYVAQSAIFGPVWVARDAGYFTRYGLDVEVANIPGATRLQQAVLAGEVDYAVAAGTPAIAATVSGVPSPLLAEFIDLPVWFLVVRPEIARIADLRGKRVGITQFGAGTDFVLRAAMREWGFEVDRDVTILQMGGTQEIFAGLAGGAIDAGPMAAPLHLRAAREGYPPLLDLADTGIHYPQMVLTATRSHLAGRDAQAANVLRALVEANYRYKRDNALALEVLTRYTGDTDPEQLQAAWASATKVLKNVPRVSEDGVRAVLDDLAISRPEARAVSYDEIVEGRYVRQLESEGFFARLDAAP